MANSLGTLSASLIAQEGLGILKAEFPFISQIVTDFSDEPIHYNQSVVTRIPTVGTVQDYSTVSGYLPSDVATTDVTLTLNKYKHASFALNDAEFSSSARNLVQDYAESFAYALGSQIMGDVSALFTTGNYNVTTAVIQTVSGANRSNIIVDCNKNLNDNKIPKNRFGIFNSELYAELMKDDSLVDLSFKGVGISSAQLPVIHGVTITDYADLPNTSNLIGVVGYKNAVVFAARPPSDAGYADLPSVARISNVSDPDTGLTVQVREFYDAKLGKRQVTYALIYGVAVGQNKSLCLIRSS